MKNKGAVEMYFLIMLVIGVIVFVVLAIMIPDLLRKGGEDTEGFFDFDNDGVVNNLDKCVCDPGIEENEGCKEGQEYDTPAERDECKEKMKKET